MDNTVLVIEDDPKVLTMLAFALRSSGHATLLYSDAESALEGLPDEKPNVILCDVNLPGMNGADFTQTLKSSPSLADTPVILMSAYDEPRRHAAGRVRQQALRPDRSGPARRGSSFEHRVTDSLRWAVTISRLGLDALLGRLGPQFSFPDL